MDRVAAETIRDRGSRRRGALLRSAGPRAGGAAHRRRNGRRRPLRAGRRRPRVGAYGHHVRSARELTEPTGGSDHARSAGRRCGRAAPACRCRGGAVVFGTSGGAVIALKLAIRAPDVARDVIVHEPPFIQVLPDAAELGRTFQAQVEQALATRGARGAMELFIRENAGSDVFDRLDPPLRERMIANGPSFFGHELAMFMSWIPSETELAGLRVPVRTLAGRDHRGSLLLSRGSVAREGLGVDLVEIPGAHAPYLAHPPEFAAALRPLLTDRQGASGPRRTAEARARDRAGPTAGLGIGQHSDHAQADDAGHPSSRAEHHHRPLKNRGSARRHGRMSCLPSRSAAG